MWELVSFAKKSGLHPKYDDEAAWRTVLRF